MLRYLISIACLLSVGLPMIAGSPREAFFAALADCQRLPAEEQRATRYLYRPGGFLPGELEALAFHVNQLSRSAELVKPRKVSENLLAVAMDDYGWDAKVWDKLADTEPYFTIRTQAVAEVVKYYKAGRYDDGRYYEAGYYREPGSKVENAPNPLMAPPAQHAALQILTGSIVPVVRADWWLATTCRQVNLRNKETGAGYYDWLGVKDRESFLKLSRFKDSDAEALGKVVRAVVDRSGVAQHGRQVVGFGALTGKVFMTLDTEELDRNNLPTELLKPGVFVHQAEEWFTQAPNGLWYMGLFDAQGKRQSTAPDFIGPDDSPLRTGRDGRIHVGLSCIRCHIEDGLRPINDWARRTFRGRVRNDIASREGQLEFRRLYLSNLDKQLEEGRQRFRESLKEINGPAWDSKKNAESFARMYARYAEELVDTKKLAEELGITEDILLVRLKTYSQTAKMPISLAALLQPGGSVRREFVEDFWFVLAVNVLGGSQ